MLRKKEEGNKDRTPCVIMCNRKLPMMLKIISYYWNVPQINPELLETFQKNAFVAFARNKTKNKNKEQKVIGRHTIKTVKSEKKCKTEKENLNLATQISYHYLASRPSTLIHTEVIKQSSYTPYFTIQL